MTKAQLKRMVESMGATYEESSDGRWRDMRATAPQGMAWNSDGVHELVGGCYFGQDSWYRSARAELAERVQYGVSECGDAECEWCGKA